MELNGSVALVTGGSGGLGSVIAQTLATNGVDIVAGYRERRSEAEHVLSAIEDLGRRGCVVQIDQTEPAPVESAVETSVAEMGHPWGSFVLPPVIVPPRMSVSKNRYALPGPSRMPQPKTNFANRTERLRTFVGGSSPTTVLLPGK